MSRDSMLTTFDIPVLTSDDAIAHPADITHDTTGDDESEDEPLATRMRTQPNKKARGRKARRQKAEIRLVTPNPESVQASCTNCGFDQTPVWRKGSTAGLQCKSCGCLSLLFNCVERGSINTVPNDARPAEVQSSPLSHPPTGAMPSVKQSHSMQAVSSASPPPSPYQGAPTPSPLRIFIKLFFGLLYGLRAALASLRTPLPPGTIETSLQSLDQRALHVPETHPPPAAATDKDHQAELTRSLREASHELIAALPPLGVHFDIEPRLAVLDLEAALRQLLALEVHMQHDYEDLAAWRLADIKIRKEVRILQLQRDVVARAGLLELDDADFAEAVLKLRVRLASYDQLV